MTPTRRHLLQHALLLGAGATLPRTRLWAAEGAPAGASAPGSAPARPRERTAPTDMRLLLVFLRGAYDATNVLVPITSPFYAEARPHIAIAPPGPGADCALPLATDWGLAPALRDTLWRRAQAGEIAFVPFAGLHDETRSHFETQDRVELGLPLPGEPGSTPGPVPEGFLNRLARELGLGTGPQDSDSRVMAFTERLPLVLQGPRPVPNLSLSALGRGADPRHVALVERLWQGDPLAARLRDGLETRAEVSREINQDMAAEMKRANRDAVTARGFELEARRIAWLMREQVRLGFIDIGGWDTHINQGGATGALASRLGELGRGLAAFADGMGADWQRTVVVVVSEFGRTFRENGNRGTDHGHGSVWWVMGGGVQGGVRGEQVAQTAATLHQGRDWPVLNEGRAMLGGLFQRLYGLDKAAVARVFPGAVPRDIGLV